MMLLQLMVSKNEVVKQLEEQGVDVADLEEQLCSMARDLVNAAQHQVIFLEVFMSGRSRTSKSILVVSMLRFLPVQEV